MQVVELSVETDDPEISELCRLYWAVDPAGQDLHIDGAAGTVLSVSQQPRHRLLTGEDAFEHAERVSGTPPFEILTFVLDAVELIDDDHGDQKMKPLVGVHG